MKRAFKTKIVTGNHEASYLSGCAGYARYVWNACLSMHDWHWRNGDGKYGNKMPSINSDNKITGQPAIKKRFRALAKTDHPFKYDYPSCIEDAVLQNLQAAFTRYWDARKKGDVKADIERKKRHGAYERWLKRQFKQGRKGVQCDPVYPQYKSKFRDTPSFNMVYPVVSDDGTFQIRAARRSPWAKHNWRLQERGYVPAGKHSQVTISQATNGDWYASFLVDVGEYPKSAEKLDAPLHDSVLGADVGVAVQLATSDGDMYALAPKQAECLAKLLKRKKTLQKKMSRQRLQNGGVASENWKKSKSQLGKVQHRINNIRTAQRHNITADIVYNKRHAVVGVEGLNVQNMTASARPKLREDGNGYAKNNKRQKAGLNRTILENAPYELRRQLEYKTAWTGAEVVAVNPAYTSQTCAECGHVSSENRKSQSLFVCVECGHSDNADTNAARVIAQRAKEIVSA